MKYMLEDLLQQGFKPDRFHSDLPVSPLALPFSVSWSVEGIRIVIWLPDGKRRQFSAILSRKTAKNAFLKSINPRPKQTRKTEFTVTAQHLPNFRDLLSSACGDIQVESCAIQPGQFFFRIDTLLDDFNVMVEWIKFCLASVVGSMACLPLLPHNIPICWCREIRVFSKFSNKERATAEFNLTMAQVGSNSTDSNPYLAATLYFIMKMNVFKILYRNVDTRYMYV
ncbi:hypothetical protein Y032_0001g138 [Ancylostoma ceylanicum]|uniref:Uncharacterized protein n=1 Tax=Ancylostoma ceylanicum TaxID=53326 RepID=A0A016W2J4_9BILA|nr:hypothetical protein Y032_0001g138 [Ancylostoma ceylanicum]